MISVDSNIIFSAIESDDTNHTEALLRLGAAGRAEVLTLSPVVYTELMASTMRSFIRAFLYRAVDIRRHRFQGSFSRG